MLQAADRVLKRAEAVLEAQGMHGSSLIRMACLLVLAVSSAGCIEYDIYSPDHSLVLARGKTDAAVGIIQRGAKPYLQQRHFGLLNGLVYFSENSTRSAISADYSDVVLSGGKDFVDSIIGVVTSGYTFFIPIFPFFVSNTVRIYTDVQ